MCETVTSEKNLVNISQWHRLLGFPVTAQQTRLESTCLGIAGPFCAGAVLHAQLVACGIAPPEQLLFLTRRLTPQYVY